MIRWENWLVFCVRIRTCAVEQESPPTFYFILKERLKKHSKNLLRYFVGSGGRLWKGKVLAPFSSMVIHGLLVTWFFRSLALFFDCFKNGVCVWVLFEKKMPCLRQLMYLTRVWVFYKSVNLFEKMFSNVFESLFESVVDCGFWKEGKCFCKFDLK